MTLKNIFIAATLTLSIAAAAFAEEPKNTPTTGSAPVAAAPAVPGAPVVAAPGAMTTAPAVAPPLTKKRELKANKAITLSMFAVIIGITLAVVV